MTHGKESACQSSRHRFHPRDGKIPWRRKWQPAPVFLPGGSHGRRSLVGYSPWGRKESAMTQQPGKQGLGLPRAHGDLGSRGSSADRASMPGPGAPEPRRLSGHRAGRCQAGTPRPTSAAGSRPQAAPPLLGGGSTGGFGCPSGPGEKGSQLTFPTAKGTCAGWHLQGFKASLLTFSSPPCRVSRTLPTLPPLLAILQASGGRTGFPGVAQASPGQGGVLLRGALQSLA